MSNYGMKDWNTHNFQFTNPTSNFSDIEVQEIPLQITETEVKPKEEDDEGSILGDIATGLINSPKHIGKGVLDSLVNLQDTALKTMGYALLGDVGATVFSEINKAYNPVHKVADYITPEIKHDSVTGELIESTAQFLLPFTAMGKAKVFKNLAGKGVSGRLTSDAIKGAIADGVAFSEDDERLSDFTAEALKELETEEDSIMQDTVELATDIANFLRTNEDDDFLEQKLKQMAEGAGLGLIADGVIEGVIKLNKGVKAVTKANDNKVELDDVDVMDDAQGADVFEDIGDSQSSDFLIDDNLAEADDIEIPPLTPEQYRAGIQQEDLYVRKPRRVNYARIDTSEDVKNLIETLRLEPDTLAHIDKRSRGTQTWGDTIKEAKSIDGLEVAIQRKVGDTLNAGEITAVRIVMVDLAEKLHRSAIELLQQNKKETLLPRDLKVKKVAFRKLADVFHMVHAEYVSAAAETARTMNALRITAGSYLTGKDIKMLDSFLDDTIASDDNLDAIIKSVAKMDLSGQDLKSSIDVLGDAIRDPKTKVAFDAVMDLRITNLLTQPSTHIYNAISGGTLHLANVAERVGAGVIGKTLGNDASKMYTVSEAMSLILPQDKSISNKSFIQSMSSDTKFEDINKWAKSYLSLQKLTLHNALRGIKNQESFLTGKTKFAKTERLSMRQKLGLGTARQEFGKLGENLKNMNPEVLKNLANVAAINFSHYQVANSKYVGALLNGVDETWKTQIFISEMQTKAYEEVDALIKKNPTLVKEKILELRQRQAWTKAKNPIRSFEETQALQKEIDDYVNSSNEAFEENILKENYADLIKNVSVKELEELHKLYTQTNVINNAYDIETMIKESLDTASELVLESPIENKMLKQLEDLMYVPYQGANGESNAGSYYASRVLRDQMTFFRTAVNQVSWLFKRVAIVNLMDADERAIWRGERGQDARNRQMARIGFGTTATLYGAQLAMDGILTGDFAFKTTEDRNQSGTARAIGRAEFSLAEKMYDEEGNVTGVTYHSLRGVEPVTTLLKIGGGLARYLNVAENNLGYDDDSSVRSAVNYMISTVLKMSDVDMFRGLEDLYKFIGNNEDDNQQGIKQYLAQQVKRSVVPLGVSRIEKTLSPQAEIHDKASASESILTDLPFLSHMLPAAYDIFGKPVYETRTVGKDALDDAHTEDASMLDSMIIALQNPENMNPISVLRKEEYKNTKENRLVSDILNAGLESLYTNLQNRRRTLPIPNLPDLKLSDYPEHSSTIYSKYLKRLNKDGKVTSILEKALKNTERTPDKDKIIRQANQEIRELKIEVVSDMMKNDPIVAKIMDTHIRSFVNETIDEIEDWKSSR